MFRDGNTGISAVPRNIPKASGLEAKKCSKSEDKLSYIYRDEVKRPGYW